MREGNGMHFWRTSISRGTCVFVFLWAAILLFSDGMGRPLNHDEHQFIASAKLFVDQGLLPYRDFPYFHMPYSFIFIAPLLRFSPYMLLMGRLVSILFGAAIIAALFGYSFRLMHVFNRGARLALSGAIAYLLLANRLFVYTSGYAWNHNQANFFCLAAFLLMVGVPWEKLSLRRMTLTGALVGISVGTRLTFIGALAAFVMTILFATGGSRGLRMQRAAFFGLGATLALIPCGVLFWMAPEQFFFGNVHYQKLNSWYGEGLGGCLWRNRHEYFVEKILSSPSTLALCFVGCVVLAATLVLYRAIGHDRIKPPLLASALAIAGLGGAFLPCPSRLQYFSAFIVFLAVGIATCVPLLSQIQPMKTPAVIIIAVGVIFVGLYGAFKAGSFPHKLRQALLPSTWRPMVLHKEGQSLRKHVPLGPVLTLGPLYPLEGGLAIYPELALGPFPWRTARFLDEKRRARLMIIGPDTFERLCARQPPAGILTGLDNHEEKLIEYARRNRYQKVPFGHKRALWIRPQTVTPSEQHD